MLGASFFPVVYGVSQYNDDTSSSSSSSSSSTTSVSSRLSPDDKSLCLADFKTGKTQAEISKISLDGFIAKNKRDYDTAIPLLEEAVRYGHLNSMVLLGQICEAKKDVRTAYTWYVLAFEEHWLNTGQHLPTAKKELQKVGFIESVSDLLKRNKDGYRKKLPKPSIFSICPEHYHKNSGYITQIVQGFFSGQSFCLNQQSSKFRELRFYAVLQGLSGSPDPWFDLGTIYSREKNYRNEAICYERSRTSDSLHNLGFLNVSGLLEDEPNFEEGAKCYELANKPETWCSLGRLYQEGRLAGSTKEKAAECYRRSKTGLAWVILGNLLEDGEINGVIDVERAAECYNEAISVLRTETSKEKDLTLKKALFYLGYLHAGKKLKNSSVETAMNFFEQSDTPLAWLNRGILLVGANVKEAILSFEKSGLPVAKISLLEIYTQGYRNSLLDLDESHRKKDAQELLIKKIEGLTSEINSQMDRLSLSDKHYCLGRLAAMNHDYQTACINFSQAL